MSLPNKKQVSNGSFSVKLEYICYAFTFCNKNRQKIDTLLCCVGSEVVSVAREQKTYTVSVFLEFFCIITTTQACITPTLKVNT